jgi:hypothetical protein
MMRYIAGLDAGGKSAVLKRSESSRTFTWTNSSEKAPHFVERHLVDDPGSFEPGEHSGALTELYTTRMTPDGIVGEDPDDYAMAPGLMSLDVPAGVTRWCVASYGPGYQSKMHCTDSIDFDMCIAGEMTLILETEEIVLRPGDAVYLPRLQHAWRTDTGGTFAFLMISPHAT